MEIDWNRVEKILIVRLRSIGDTVLTTPSIKVLRDFLPDAQIDILLEDWVAPLFEGFELIDSVITTGRRSIDRLKTARLLRQRKYDLVYNMHGGTTSTFLVRATGARYRFGFEYFRFGFLYTHRSPDAACFWNRPVMHSAEQQLALVGFSGVPFDESPGTSLAITDSAASAVSKKLKSLKVPTPFALIHPAAAYETKRWREVNFARIIEHLESLGIASVLVTTEDENWIVEGIRTESQSKLYALSGLTLPEVSALASKSEIFVGNDSGIAHIAAAVGIRVVVIFGSSNSDVWRPWTKSRYRVVSFPLDCQPCPGDKCRVYGEPKCILSVAPEKVIEAIDEVLAKAV